MVIVTLYLAGAISYNKVQEGVETANRNLVKEILKRMAQQLPL